MKRIQAFAAALVALAAVASAKIDLVTLPERDRTQVTIYRSADLTLVRETRTLTFAKGANSIQFSWGDMLVDPKSVQLRFPAMPDHLAMVDTVFPAETEALVQWNVEADRDCAEQAEITYFLSGMSWSASYAIIANADESMARIEPDFTIANGSTEDLENAETRLVVGDVNLVETIARIVSEWPREAKAAYRYDPTRGDVSEGDVWRTKSGDEPIDLEGGIGGGKRKNEMARLREVAKEAVSEYQLYTISGRSDIDAGASIRLPDPRVDEVPIELSFEYIPDKWGPQAEKFYKLKNNGDHKLGKAPLPEGTWYAYRGDGADSLRFEGQAVHLYVPVGEDIELRLGNDGSVIVEEKELAFTRRAFAYDSKAFSPSDSGDLRGYETVREMAVEIRNSNARAVPVKVRLNLGRGDWSVEGESDASKRYDRERLEWEIEAPANATKKIRYTVIERHGSLAEATK